MEINELRMKMDDKDNKWYNINKTNRSQSSHVSRKRLPS